MVGALQIWPPVTDKAIKWRNQDTCVVINFDWFCAIFDYEQQDGDFIAEKNLFRGYIVLFDKLYYYCTIPIKWHWLLWQKVEHYHRTAGIRKHQNSSSPRRCLLRRRSFVEPRLPSERSERAPARKRIANGCHHIHAACKNNVNKVQSE